MCATPGATGRQNNSVQNGSKKKRKQCTVTTKLKSTVTSKSISIFGAEGGLRYHISDIFWICRHAIQTSIPIAYTETLRLHQYLS